MGKNHQAPENINKDWHILPLIAILFIFYLWGIGKVPFHPDESTQIYMSKDIALLIRQPLSLSWDSSQYLSPEARYRAIDAPLTRYLIGVCRGLFSIPPLSSDWDWTTDWQTNLTAGAVPNEKQLVFSRIALAWLFPISLYLFYSSIRVVLPRVSATIAIILLGLNPLILLHSRRAMAEASLLFGVTLFLWASTRKNNNPWLLGLSLAIAFNAKQSAFVLMPVGAIALCLLPDEKLPTRKILLQISKFLGIFMVISFLLNPFYWRNPLQALKTSLQERAELTAQQSKDHLGNTGAGFRSIPDRILAEIVNIYLSPPATEEVGNYRKEIRLSKEAYFKNPAHNWSQGNLVGIIFFIFSIAGLIVINNKYNQYSSLQRKTVRIFTLSTTALFLWIAALIPWQRYVVPLLPLTIFWISAGLMPITESINNVVLGNKND